MLVMGENNNIASMTKKKLREMFGVSEVTISKTYKKIEKIKHILSDDKEVERIMNKMKLDESEEEEEIDPIILERMKKFNIKPDNNEKMKLDNNEKVKLVISKKEKEKEKDNIKDKISIKKCVK
jgi:hypothetical protein